MTVIKVRIASWVMWSHVTEHLAFNCHRYTVFIKENPMQDVELHFEMSGKIAPSVSTVDTRNTFPRIKYETYMKPVVTNSHKDNYKNKTVIICTSI